MIPKDFPKDMVDTKNDIRLMKGDAYLVTSSVSESGIHSRSSKTLPGIADVNPFTIATRRIIPFAFQDV